MTIRRPYWIRLALALALYVAVRILTDGQPDQIGAGLGLLALIAWLWLTEALDVSVTALLVPLIAAASGIFRFDQALLAFADPIIFLFLGGFALAAGLRRHGIDRWLSLQVLKLAGDRLAPVARALFWMTAILSMWISNTATAAMMLPLALGLLAPFPYAENRAVYWYVLLGMAFAANIGGMGTLVGSPPNAIAGATAGIGFVEWMMWGIPVVLLLMPLMEIGLRYTLRPNLDLTVAPPDAETPWTRERVGVLVIFGLTVSLWVFGAPLGKALGIGSGFDAAVALLALVLLNTFGLASWRDIDSNVDWGALLLFGGGLCLGAALDQSGAGAWLAGQLESPLAMIGLLACVMLMITFAMALTEVTSNTASAALLIPLFIGMAPHIDHQVIAVTVAMACSCAFLLPVATPPNAIAYGSGKLPQAIMIRGGAGVTALALPLLFAAAAVMLALRAG